MVVDMALENHQGTLQEMQSQCCKQKPISQSQTVTLTGILPPGGQGPLPDTKHVESKKLPTQITCAEMLKPPEAKLLKRGNCPLLRFFRFGYKGDETNSICP